MVIFGAGVITGGVLVHKTGTVTKPRVQRPVPAGTNAPLPTVTPAQLQRMDFLVRATRELELTGDQRERIERIIREGQERSRLMWEEARPDMLTADGRQLTGLIAAETATSITLKRADNAIDTVLRIDIEQLKSTGVSLMPEGLEKQVDVAGMADLLEFLKSVE